MSILLILFGLILVLESWYQFKVSLGIIAGIYLIVEGFHLIYLDVTSKFVLIPLDGIIPGVLSIIFGCVLISSPRAMTGIITIIIGTWIIAKKY